MFLERKIAYATAFTRIIHRIKEKDGLLGEGGAEIAEISRVCVQASNDSNVNFVKFEEENALQSMLVIVRGIAYLELVSLLRVKGNVIPGETQ